MSRVKDIRLKVIPSKIANEFVKKFHYSGKVVSNSSLHFGAFLDGKLHGVMSYGSPLDKRKVLPLVVDKNGDKCKWNDMLELNRMAFDDYLPKFSESRCIAVSVRLLKKHAPHIKWILSFSDGTQCGDGTIYRASGFSLVGIKENENTVQLPNGDVVHKMTLESSPTSPRHELEGKSYYGLTGGRYDFKKYAKATGGEILKGYQLKYVMLIDKTLKCSQPLMDFSDIDKAGAGMYKGEKITLLERQGRDCTASSQLEVECATNNTINACDDNIDISTSKSNKKIAKV